MNTKLNILIVVLVLLGIGVTLSVFTVDERETAIKFRFGEIVRADYEPGLHFKVPFVNNTMTFPTVILTRNNPQEQFLTSEKKNLIVDFFVKWRITDVAQYYRATAGQERAAAQRLLEIIKDDLRAEFAKRTVQEVVSAERAAFMESMIARTQETAEDLGVQVVDVRVKRIELPDQVSESVFERMRQERNRQAKQLRAEGAELSEQIRAEADRERTVILANAYRDAERIRGEGDAEAARIYAEAFGRNEEFYAFYRSMEAYRNSMGRNGDVLVLEPDSEFFRYLTNQGGGR